MKITPYYAAVCAVLLVALGARVSRLRGTLSVGIGDGGVKNLQRAIRAHANLAEFMPTALVLLVIAEIQGAAALVLHALGGALVVSRILHAIGLTRSSGTSPERFLGTALTWTVILANAGVCVYYAAATR